MTWCIDFSQDTDFQQQLVKNTPDEDVKKYLLATIEFGQEIQGEIDLYVADNSLKIRNQNPIELLLKDIKRFNAQNPVIGSFIREIDIGYKKDLRANF